MASTVDPSRVFSDPNLIALANAAQRGDVSGVRRSLASGANPNAAGDVIGSKRMTPIVFAILAPTPEALQVLLAAGAKPNVVFEGNTTPLLFAVGKKDPQFTALLLNAGADPNIPVAGGTVLGHAMIAECDDSVRLLLQHRANPNAIHDNDPLVRNAVYWETLRYVPLLMDAGAAWSEDVSRTLCGYVKNKGPRLDRSEHYYRDLQSTWDYLTARGIRLPCARLS